MLNRRDLSTKSLNSAGSYRMAEPIRQNPGPRPAQRHLRSVAFDSANTRAASVSVKSVCVFMRPTVSPAGVDTHALGVVAQGLGVDFRMIFSTVARLYGLPFTLFESSMNHDCRITY